MWWSDRVYVMWMQPLRKIAEQVYIAMRKIVFLFFIFFTRQEKLMVKTCVLE